LNPDGSEEELSGASQRTTPKFANKTRAPPTPLMSDEFVSGQNALLPMWRKVPEFCEGIRAP
jgi:hypothetical protein